MLHKQSPRPGAFWAPRPGAGDTIFVGSEPEQGQQAVPQAEEEAALRSVICRRLHRSRFGGRLGGLVEELHPAGRTLGRTGKAGVVGEAAGHLLHHGLQGVELVGIQRTGELRNALLVELHEAAAELVGAVLELEHTVIQGGCAAAS